MWILKDIISKLEVEEVNYLIYTLAKLELQAKVETLNQILQLIHEAKRRNLTLDRVIELIKKVLEDHEMFLELTLAEDPTFESAYEWDKREYRITARIPVKSGKESK